MEKIFISIALTLFLGPGVGHLYLRYFRRGIVIIGTTLVVAVHLAWRAAGSLPAAALGQQTPSQLFQNFLASHPGILTWYDAVFAAIWAFAIIDVYLISRALVPVQTDLDDEQQ
jgi:hypothetical protein